MCVCTSVSMRVQQQRWVSLVRVHNMNVSTPSPLSQHLKRGFSLSPALHHPAWVHGCQETSGNASAHGPEGLETTVNTKNSTTKYGQRRTQKHIKKNKGTATEDLKRNLNLRSINQQNLLCIAHLQQAVSHKCNQKLVAIALAHHGGILWGIHAGEVEHGYVRLPIVVDGKVQCGQLVVGGEIRSLTGVRQQGSLVYISPGQQQLCVCIVLQEQ